jgi:hypothetical protein
MSQKGGAIIVEANEHVQDANTGGACVTGQKDC